MMSVPRFCATVNPSPFRDEARLCRSLREKGRVDFWVVLGNTDYVPSRSTSRRRGILRRDSIDSSANEEGHVVAHASALR